MGRRTIDRAERDPVARTMHEPATDYSERVVIVRSDEDDAALWPFVRGPDDSVPMPLKVGTGRHIDAMRACYV